MFFYRFGVRGQRFGVRAEASDLEPRTSNPSPARRAGTKLAFSNIQTGGFICRNIYVILSKAAVILSVAKNLCLTLRPFVAFRVTCRGCDVILSKAKHLIIWIFGVKSLPSRF